MYAMGKMANQHNEGKARRQACWLLFSGSGVLSCWAGSWSTLEMVTQYARTQGGEGPNAFNAGERYQRTGLAQVVSQGYSNGLVTAFVVRGVGSSAMPRIVAMADRAAVSSPLAKA